VREQLLPLCDPVYLEKFDRLKTHTQFFEDRRSSTPTRVLLLGSSRSEMGFDAQRFAEQQTGPTLAFNFATPGGGPITNALYLRRLLQSGMKPDRVLMEIHPCLLCGDMEKNWLIGYRLRSSETEFMNSIRIYPQSVAHLGWQGWFTAVHAYRYPVLNRYAERWLPCPFGFTLGDRQDAFGFVAGLDIPIHERPVALRKSLEQYGPVMTNFQPGGPALAALQDIVSTCKGQGIPLVLFLSPEAKPFREGYQTGSAERLNDVLATLGVPVLDCRDCVPDDLFADGHHLMPEGASVFTDALAKLGSAKPR
jgi:Protein of unknown function (DUF1574)